jgi:hypothetical protein
MGCHGTDYTAVVCYFTVCSIGCHATDYMAVVCYFIVCSMGYKH